MDLLWCVPPLFPLASLPNLHDLLAYRLHVQQRYDEEQQAAGQQAGQERTASRCGEQVLQYRCIVAARPGYATDGKEQDKQVQACRQEVVGEGHLGGAVAYQQQGLQFRAVLLQQQEDAQHQDVEGEQADEQSHGDHR